MGKKRFLAAGGAGADNQASYWLNIDWLFGGFLWLLGNGTCWVAAGLAPQSLLSCLDCWNIIIALVVGHFWFGERVTQQMLIGGSMLVIGVCWVITFGPKTYKPETPQLILEACQSFRTIFILAATAMLLVSIAISAYQHRNRRPMPLTFMQLTSISAVLGWYASVFSRSMAALILTSATSTESRSSFISNTFLFFLAAFVFCAICQIHFLNLAMQIGDAVVVLPAYMGMSMTGQIVVGGLFFDEFQNMSWSRDFFFMIGVAFVVAALVMLVHGRHRK